jgi:hypothetical protein
MYGSTYSDTGYNNPPLTAMDADANGDGIIDLVEWAAVANQAGLPLPRNQFAQLQKFAVINRFVGGGDNTTSTGELQGTLDAIANGYGPNPNPTGYGYYNGNQTSTAGFPSGGTQGSTQGMPNGVAQYAPGYDDATYVPGSAQNVAMLTGNGAEVAQNPIGNYTGYHNPPQQVPLSQLSTLDQNRAISHFIRNVDGNVSGMRDGNIDTTEAQQLLTDLGLTDTTSALALDMNRNGRLDTNEILGFADQFGVTGTPTLGGNDGNGYGKGGYMPNKAIYASGYNGSEDSLYNLVTNNMGSTAPAGSPAAGMFDDAFGEIPTFGMAQASYGASAYNPYSYQPVTLADIDTNMDFQIDLNELTSNADLLGINLDTTVPEQFQTMGQYIFDIGGPDGFISLHEMQDELDRLNYDNSPTMPYQNPYGYDGGVLAGIPNYHPTQVWTNPNYAGSAYFAGYDDYGMNSYRPTVYHSYSDI